RLAGGHDALDLHDDVRKGREDARALDVVDGEPGNRRGDGQRDGGGRVATLRVAGSDRDRLRPGADVRRHRRGEGEDAVAVVAERLARAATDRREVAGDRD